MIARSWVKYLSVELTFPADKHVWLSGHLSLTPLMAAYDNHSREWPAPVMDTFFTS